MVWTSYDSQTGIRTYRSGGSPYDRTGPGGGNIFHSGDQNQGSYFYSPAAGGGKQRWDWVADAPSSNQSGTVTSPPPDASVATGIDPGEIHNALYSKIIPLSALGLARIGTAGLIFGPYFNAGAASFAVSFGFPANPEGTRRVYEVSLDSKVAWELAAGSPAGALNPAGFLAEAFTCRFYAGTQSQGADPLEAAIFGDQSVAYRPQMMLWFDRLPLAPFGGKVPFVSAKIGDVTSLDGINLGEALEHVAYSPWLEMDDTFESVGVTDIVQAMILTEDQSFLNMLQVTARVYRTLDILQTDKLRVSDRGPTVTPDLTLDRDRIVGEAGVGYTRQEEASVARELELTTIDPDADYVFMPSKAARPIAPVPVTSSVAKDSILLPVVIGATTRASLVTFAKYAEDHARKRVSLQTMLAGYELEPGDLFSLSDVAAGFDDAEVWKVIETSHGANYVNELTGEAILKCALPFAPGAGAEHVTCVNAEVTSTTHTFANVDLGTAHANRTSVVGINLWMTAIGQTITSVSINGVSATQAVASNHLGAGLISAIWYAATPTGAAGDIVVTTSGNFQQISAHIYRLVSSTVVLEDTDSAVATATASPISVSVTSGSGITIAAAATRQGASFTWGGISADCTFVNDAQTTGQKSSASVVGSGAVISVDPSSIDNVSLVAAAFALS